jgi:hypothetical protein
MKRVSEKFKELQSHLKIETSPEETRKIELLKKAAKEIGLSEDETKEIWLFSGVDEKSIFSGQYNNLFYWVSQESLKKDFLDVLDIYFHETAHKKGPHGDPQFEYYESELKKKIQKYILERREDFEKMQKEWEGLSVKK